MLMKSTYKNICVKHFQIDHPLSKIKLKYFFICASILGAILNLRVLSPSSNISKNGS